MLSRIGIVGLILVLAGSHARAEDAVDTLPGTQPLTWEEEDLSGRLMDAAHAFVERKIADAASKRNEFWPYDLSSREGYVASIRENRSRLKTVLGVVDRRVPIRLERYGEYDNPALVAETENYRVYQVRWPVLDGVFGEGLLARPKGLPIGHVVVIPDAGLDPENALGVATQFAENGLEVIVPQVLSHEKWMTDDPQLARAGYSDREWIYRQAYHMGRHVIGYEIQRTLAAVDWFADRREAGAKIAVAGYGEGGHTAFLASAIDERIDVTLVGGYFAPREQVWAEPIYRNVWSRLRRFGDAEVASLVLPRKLILEHRTFPEVTDRKGDIVKPTVARVRMEFERIPKSEHFSPPELVIDGDGHVGPFSVTAASKFVVAVGKASLNPPAEKWVKDVRRAPTEEIHRRRQRAVQELERHVQSLVRKSEHVRDDFFLYSVMPELANSRWSTKRVHPVHTADKFIAGATAFRRKFKEQAMGTFEEPFLPFNTRTRKVAETEAWTAYDVVLDVFDGLFSWGVLVVPKDLQEGERRPVVVCQHGRQGVPRDTIDAHHSAYNDFAARLAERGFITFAPHNLYRGEDRYRWLDRKANTIGCTLFSFIIPQHDQTLRWLDTLPFVDGNRIAFYGLSYGGETAVRVPTILEKYCLSICSGDFNQWTRKIAATDQPFSFMRTIEWEMPYWNLGHTFDYAEMAYLMAPRPFMVERGHLDRVGRDQWVAHEFAKVRWLYAQLGLADHVEIEFFQGGHSINGVGTFAFLHHHLNWPAPDEGPERKESKD